MTKFLTFHQLYVNNRLTTIDLLGSVTYSV